MFGNFYGVNIPAMSDFNHPDGVTEHGVGKTGVDGLSWADTGCLLLTIVLQLYSRQTLHGYDIVYFGANKKQAVADGRQNRMHFFTENMQCSLILWMSPG